MKINQHFQIPNLVTNVRERFLDNSTNLPAHTQSTTFQSYPAIYFTGKLNPEKLTPKRINFSKEKETLINQFDDILKNDITEKEMTEEELHLYQLNKTTEYLNREFKKLLRCQTEISLLHARPNNQQRYEDAKRLQREVQKIQRNYENPPKFLPHPKKQNPQDAKTDFVLINKFKSAAMDDNYDFRGVYLDHYSGLKDVKTIKELKQKYPKIEIPKNPTEVVSKKITNSLTRDFFIELDNLHKTGNKDACKDYVTGKIISIIDSQLKKATPEEKKEITRKLLSPATSSINKKYRAIKENDSFSSIPEKRKQNLEIISDNDKKLLTVDYNDFVLTTVREQYLGLKKPNDIVYTYTKGKPGKRTDKTIKISELKNSEYKFPKISESLKSILSKGDELKFAQRNYDCFTKDEFIERLEFHADRQESNEDFLDTLVKFSSCRFEGEDIDMVKKFLREADEVIDGKKSVEDVVRFTERNGISPKGTERLTEKERQARMNELKEEQKRHAKLKRNQQLFDDSINLFYLNDMAYTAEICSEFRPKSLDKAEQVKSDYITSVIKKYTEPNDNTTIINKNRLATELTRWKKYCAYKENGINDEILTKAEKYGTDKKGKLNYDKAGKYIINYEAVNTYPQSFECATNKDAAEAIMENFKNDKDGAVEYLCKYDDYLDLSVQEKAKIKNILKIFNKKDPLDKSLLKKIVLEEYANLPTTEWATMNEAGSKKVLATIAPKGKAKLIDYHPFPSCVDYFEKFEEALPHFATKRSSFGIKKLDDSLYELKILDHEDRFIAQNDNYYFDNYFDELHKKKAAKQKLKR